MPPKTKLWPIGEQTPGKHRVLKSYLQAWLPIMGIHQGRIIFIDGFAGPGEYEGGQDGSPIIALKAFDEHNSRKLIKAEVIFLFVEERRDRAQHLSQLVEKFKEKLPANCIVEVETGEFSATLSRILDKLEHDGQFMAPAFVMIDPFGVKHAPMSLVARVLNNPKSEIYISFMYEAINRHKASAEFEEHLDALFGTQNWRDGLDIADPGERKEFFYGLYTQQLRAAGAKYVVHFELYEGNRLVYTIFFATKHELGCDRMKEAIWRVAPSGDFEFRGRTTPQITLDLESPDFSILQDDLREVFGSAQGWVAVDKIERWMKTDQTDFYSGQLKRVLKTMEVVGLLEADPKSRNRKGTYPKGTRVRLKPL